MISKILEAQGLLSISELLSKVRSIVFVSIALASAMPSAFAQNAIRPEILEVIGDPETGKIPSCDESAFASILLFLPRTVYNTGEAVVTSRLVHRIVQTPLGLCQMVVDPKQGWDTLGNSAVNPLGMINDTVTSVSKTIINAPGVPSRRKTERIQLGSRNTLPIDTPGLEWQLLKPFNPAVHYQLLIDGEPLPRGKDSIVLARKFELESDQMIGFHRENLLIESDEPEAVIIQRILDHRNEDPGKYDTFISNCAGYARRLAKWTGLGFPSIPNLGLGCQIGKPDQDYDPILRTESDLFIRAMRDFIIKLETKQPLNQIVRDHLASHLSSTKRSWRMVWAEYYVTLLDAVLRSGDLELLNWLIALDPSIYSTEAARKKISLAWQHRSLLDRMVLLRFSNALEHKLVTPEFEGAADIWYETLAKPLNHPHTFYQSVSEKNPVRGETKFEFVVRASGDTSIKLTPWGQDSVHLTTNLKTKKMSAVLHWDSETHGRCTGHIDDIFQPKPASMAYGLGSFFYREISVEMKVDCSKTIGSLITSANVRVSYGKSNAILSFSPMFNQESDAKPPVLMMHFQHSARPLYDEQQWEKVIWMEHSKVKLGVDGATAVARDSDGMASSDAVQMGGGVPAHANSAK